MFHKYLPVQVNVLSDGSAISPQAIRTETHCCRQVVCEGDMKTV